MVVVFLTVVNGTKVGIVFFVISSTFPLGILFAKHSSVYDDGMCLQYGSNVVHAWNPLPNNLQKNNGYFKGFLAT